MLNGEAYLNDSVTLTSSDPHVVVPSTVGIPNHYYGTTFNVTTTAVTKQTVVTLTAKSGGITLTTLVTLTP
jgi:hypothetical protein